MLNLDEFEVIVIVALVSKYQTNMKCKYKPNFGFYPLSMNLFRFIFVSCTDKKHHESETVFFIWFKNNISSIKKTFQKPIWN